MIQSTDNNRQFNADAMIDLLARLLVEDALRMAEAPKEPTTNGEPR